MKSLFIKAKNLISKIILTLPNKRKLKKFLKNTEGEKRIVLFSHESTKTGAPILLANLAKELRSRGYKILIISKYPGNMDVDFASSSDEYIIRTSKSFLKSFKNTNIDIILNTICTAIYAPIMKGDKNNIICLIHEMPDVMNNSLGIKKDKIINVSSYADTMVFPSNYHLGLFKEAYGEIKTKVIIKPQGLYKSFDNKINKLEAKKYITEKHHIDPSSYIYVAVGYIAKIKGFDYLLSLAKYNYSKKIHFIWVGEDKDGYLEEAKKELNIKELPNNITITGYIADNNEIMKYYLASEAYLLLSRRDSFPSSLLEAFSLGRPVIAFDKCGGYIELVNPKSGFLVEPYNLEEYSKIIDKFDSRNPQYKDNEEYLKKLIKEEFLFNKYVDKIMELMGK